MAIIRVEKNKNYTVMSNYHLRDENLSLKAKGLLSMMLSLPENWDYSVAGLTKICKESINTINAIIHELERFNYMERKRVYKNGKIVNWEYVICEEPNLYLKNEDIENQYIENVDIENCTQLNTNILNNNKLNNKERTKFVPPTLEEVKQYAKEKNRLDLAQKFYDYFTADEDNKKHWIDSKGNKVKNWKQKFLTWCSYGNNVVNIKKDGNFTGREYEGKDMNKLFQNVDDIEI